MIPPGTQVFSSGPAKFSHSKVNHLRLSLSLAAPSWLANRECKVDAVSVSIGLKLFSIKILQFITHHVTTCRWKGFFIMANLSLEYRRREPDDYHCICTFPVDVSLTSSWPKTMMYSLVCNELLNECDLQSSSSCSHCLFRVWQMKASDVSYTCFTRWL